MVMPDDSDDEDAPANATNVNRLHAEMDALLADTSTPQLTAEQEMLLRPRATTGQYNYPVGPCLIPYLIHMPLFIYIL